MHYYKRDIGQYYKKAGRLTMLQHGAYTMLMDACYDRERFPTIDDAIDWCWASTSEEVEAVKFVLSKFFTEDGGVFKQTHITEVLAKYHETAAVNKAIAIQREENKRKANLKKLNESSTKREPTVNDSITNEHLIKNYELRTTNYELETTNHELKTKDQNTMPSKLDLFESFWENYPKKSDKKKARVAFNRLSNEKKERAINDCKTRYMQTDKKFIPLATTYIHGERWDDEVEQTKKQNNHTGFADKNYQAGATKPEDISWLND